MNWNRCKVALLTVLSCFVVSPAYANLIINGGFEQTHVGANKWRWFSADDVSGWSGSNIEIWDRFQGFDAFEGFHHAELNAHGQRGLPFSIFQNFATQIGTQYSVNFAYSARRNSNEAFLFDLFSDDVAPLMSSIIDDHQVRQWRVFSGQFIATSNTTTIRFSTLQPYSGTVGNFIDDVRVSAIAATTATTGKIAQVSEPPAFALIALTVVFLGLTKQYS